MIKNIVLIMLLSMTVALVSCEDSKGYKTDPTFQEFYEALEHKRIAMLLPNGKEFPFIYHIPDENRNLDIYKMSNPWTGYVITGHWEGTPFSLIYDDCYNRIVYFIGNNELDFIDAFSVRLYEDKLLFVPLSWYTDKQR